MVGRADAALGGVIVVWHWRVGWTGMGQPFGGLLGKGDNNKAARVRVSARARAQGEGMVKLTCQDTQSHHHLEVQGTWVSYLPCWCCCQSCLHPCLVTEDRWVRACYQTWKGLSSWPTSWPVSWLVGWCSN